MLVFLAFAELKGSQGDLGQTKSVCDFMCLRLSDDPSHSVSWSRCAIIPSRSPAYNNCRCVMDDAPSG